MPMKDGVPSNSINRKGYDEAECNDLGAIDVRQLHDWNETSSARSETLVADAMAVLMENKAVSSTRQYLADPNDDRMMIIRSNTTEQQREHEETKSSTFYNRLKAIGLACWQD